MSGIRLKMGGEKGVDKLFAFFSLFCSVCLPFPGLVYKILKFLSHFLCGSDFGCGGFGSCHQGVPGQHRQPQREAIGEGGTESGEWLWGLGPSRFFYIYK